MEIESHDIDHAEADEVVPEDSEQGYEPEDELTNDEIVRGMVVTFSKCSLNCEIETERERMKEKLDSMFPKPCQENRFRFWTLVSLMGQEATARRNQLTSAKERDAASAKANSHPLSEVLEKYGS